jgi:GTP 3',8-cyclase
MAEFPILLSPGLALPPVMAVPTCPASHVGLLRLSVTDRCNFRCRYCMPAQGVPGLAHHDLLPLERLAELVQWLVRHTEIHRVRLTGGEPLVRRGIDTLVANLAAMSGLDEVSLTTNGTLLAEMAPRLKAAGLRRVNVSLDTVDEKRFLEITRGGNLAVVLEGIEAARRAGLTPIKLNAVLRRSTWESDVPLLLDYAAAGGLEVRFIELMRTGTERAWCAGELISADEVRSGLPAEFIPLEERNAAPARRTLVAWRGTRIVVGWITPRSHPFCGRCDRLRLDARGRLRRCLMDPRQLDLEQLLRRDCELPEVSFASYLAGKTPPSAMDNALAMSQIGG